MLYATAFLYAVIACGILFEHYVIRFVDDPRVTYRIRTKEYTVDGFRSYAAAVKAHRVIKNVSWVERVERLN